LIDGVRRSEKVPKGLKPWISGLLLWELKLRPAKKAFLKWLPAISVEACSSVQG
jgi:hypothetical protein